MVNYICTQHIVLQGRNEKENIPPFKAREGKLFLPSFDWWYNILILVRWTDILVLP